MSQKLPLDQVIELSAVYYLSVFMLEVPSGYFSDRIGRRSTLLIAAGALILAHSCFTVGAGFWWFAAGQFLLAMGIAMQSGTDTAFHYDSLQALGQEVESAELEARAEQWGLVMLALAAFAGGVLGLIDLRLADVFSLLSALAMGVMVWRFVESVHTDANSAIAQSFSRVVWDCCLRLRDPVLRWIFLVVIVLYAMGARASVAWQAKMGLIGVLAVAMFLQLGIVAAMAIAASPAVLALVCLRNFPMSLVPAPVRAAIAPRIERRQRAAYLSL